MRLAVLADVHSNLPALQAVLADVDRIGPDGIWVAGDLVGYNPWPNEVLEILRERHVRAIRGNHDRGAIGGDTFRFNELAAEAVRWTRIHLTPAGVGYLKDLEDRTRGSMPELVEDGVTGVLTDGIASAVAGVKRAVGFDRGACHDAAERRFSVDRMVDDYVDVYARVLRGR